MTEKSEPTDLLGDPLRPLPDKRGRRKLRFPREVYENVEVLAAGGDLTQEEIADAIGVSVPTLTKYFRRELDKAISRQKAEQLMLLAEAARKGNVSAIKAWGAELDRQRAARALKDRERAPAPAVARKGKKEERQEAAASVASAGGKYAPPPAPKLIN